MNGFISPFVFLGLFLCQTNPTAEKSKPSHKHSLSNGHCDTKEADVTSASSTSGLTSLECRKKMQYRVDSNDTNNNFKRKSDSNIFRTVLESKLCSQESDYRRVVCQKNRTWYEIFGGFMLGLICYLRLDTVLICSVLFFFILLTDSGSWNTKLKKGITVAVGGAIAVICGVIYDVTRYDGFVISPVQWFRFNVISGNAQKLFAFEYQHGYWSEFCTDSYFVFSGIVFTVYLLDRFVLKTDILSVRNQSFWKTIAIWASFALTVFVYSVTGHTEMRFIHNCYAISAIILAISVHQVYSYALKTINNMLFTSMALWVIITLKCFHSLVMFPSADSADVSKWSYGKASLSRDLNICLDILGRKGDVSGVFVDGDLYDISGFTILKHDVPLLVRIYNEFRLYDRRKRNKYGLQDGIRIVNDYSDLFHKSNDVYLTKLLLKDNTYNYMISKRKYFIGNRSLGFHILQKCGDFVLFKRVLDDKQNNEMIETAKVLPVGRNATVLEYEANWLITNELYEKAVERILSALEISDPPRIRLYQQLVVCYHKMGDQENVSRFSNECVRRFGRQKCYTQQPKVVLHEEYSRFD